MRIILVGYGVVGKGVTTILARRCTEKVKDYGFNPKIVAIADIDGAVINPRGFSPEKLEAIKHMATRYQRTQSSVTRECQR